MTMSSTRQPATRTTSATRSASVGIVAFRSSCSWAVVAIFAPHLAPYPVGEIVDMDYFGPMSSKVLARLRLSRP